MTLLPGPRRAATTTTTTTTTTRRLTPTLLLALAAPLVALGQSVMATTPACPHPADLVVSGDTVDSTELQQACNSLQTTNLNVESGSLVGVQSGDSVQVGYGTRIDALSTLQVNVAAPDLSAISIGNTSVRALDKIYLSNLPPEFMSIDEESLSLEVRYTQVPSAPGSPVLEDDVGVFFYAPFNLNDPTVAGDVSLFFTAGNSRSDTFTLSVSPLPDSPGAMNATALKLMSQIEAGAALVGSSLQAIKQLTIPQTLQSPELMPLKHAYAILDDNGRSSALMGVLGGGSSFLNAKERQFLDQLAGYMQLDALAQQYTDVWTDELNNSGTLISAVAAGAGPAPRGLYKPDESDASDLPEKGGAISTQATAACADNPLPTTLSPAQLSKFMTLATESAIKSDAAAATLLNASGAAVGISGSLFAAAGVVTAPVSASAAAVLGGAFATHLAANGAVAGIYPRLFTNLTVNLSRVRFNLDYEDVGQYSNLNATAASTGWIADGALFDFAATAVGLGTVKNAKAATDVGELFADGLRTSTIAAESSTFGVVEDGLLGVCAAQWTVDLSDSQWSTALAVNGNFSVAPVPKTYEPREATNDVLRFFPNAAKFGFQQIKVDRAVGVDDVQVKADPSEVEIEPGDDVPISALVEFADDTRLLWNPGLGSWANGVNETDSAVSVTKTLKTPQDPESYPFDVVISSLADRKLSSGSAMIEDKVTIRTASLRVTPDYACLDSGESRGFQAFDDENQLVDVTWSVEGQGSIASTGLGSATYTAPAVGSGGSVKAFVVATSNETNTLQGRAEVDVGACTCEWEVITNVGVNSGDYSTHEFGPTPPVFLALDFFNSSFTEGGSVSGFNFSDGQTGTFESEGLAFQIQLSPTLGCTAFNNFSEPGPPVSVRLDLIENNGRVVRGQVSGICATQDVNNIANPGLSSYNLTFRSNNRTSLDSCYVSQ